MSAGLIHPGHFQFTTRTLERLECVSNGYVTGTDVKRQFLDLYRSFVLDQILALYTLVRHVFASDLGKLHFLLHRTLLEQYRSGDCIPGHDNDFDAGDATKETRPAAVKARSLRNMHALIARGFIVGLNHLGRRFRVRVAQSGVDIHLNNHAVCSLADGHAWLHPREWLPIPLDTFRRAVTDAAAGGSGG